MTDMTFRADEMPRPHRWLVLAGFVLLTLAIGWIGGIVTAPKIPTWYQGIAKPWFTPPSWLFPIAWTTLYILMAVAAWRIWRMPASDARSRGLTVWVIQLLLNAAWSPIFFGLESPGWALVEIVPFWLAVVATTVLFWRMDRPAGLMFVPYVAWVSFASVLNFAIWRMNG